MGHVLTDAPELVIAAIGGIAAGIATFIYLDVRENEKPEDERHPWVPYFAAAAVIAIVAIILYLFGAYIRVAISGR